MVSSPSRTVKHSTSAGWRYSPMTRAPTSASSSATTRCSGFWSGSSRIVARSPVTGFPHYLADLDRRAVRRSVRIRMRHENNAALLGSVRRMKAILQSLGRWPSPPTSVVGSKPEMATAKRHVRSTLDVAGLLQQRAPQRGCRPSGTQSDLGHSFLLDVGDNAEVPFGNLAPLRVRQHGEIAVSFFEPFSLLHPPTFEWRKWPTWRAEREANLPMQSKT
jgi:hypothetical protein